MKDNRRLLFYTIFAFAVLIMTVVGATYAFFESYVGSGNNSVKINSYEIKLEFEDNTDYIKTNLIPASEEVIDWAYSRDGDLKCIDAKGYEVCSVYSYSVINTSLQAPVPITSTLTPVSGNNTFHNLHFKIYRVIDNDGTTEKSEVMTNTKINFEDYNPISLSKLDTYIPASTSTTIGKVSYDIVMWLDETYENQTEEDSGKTFKATLNITSGYEGVSGLQARLFTDGDESADASLGKEE